MAMRLEGPSQGPAAGGAPQQIVVFLHGWGADGNDLIGLAPVMAPHLPHALFVSPHGPEPCDMNPMGRQWFSLENRDPHVMLAGARAAAPLIDDFVDGLLTEHGLTDDRLALVGFSQGTMMSLYVAPRRARACAAVLGYSGALIGGETLPSELRARPPIMLIHGEDDPVVPVAALNAAVEGLSAAGLSVEWHRRPHLQHGIDQAGLEMGLGFIANALSAGSA